MRVGVGFDVHAFAEGRKLILGGVAIPSRKGLQGHSDGDVLLHAISDAILGAAADGDIGQYFPDSDESIRGIDSEKIVTHALARARSKGLSVVNLDAVVICEEPKIGPYRDQLRQRIASLLSIDTGQVSIKGKTAEGLGFVGNGQGIAVYAVCLLSE
ncbi:MAG TPA: 2-C-methyl-D-erythritol 2,4-cyclodiphosphate synthase [Syntrophorhabdales bacterium]|nr:2-C-methyl-D-erythritol 2,4-cyclodiphosphate synthase [Syntrophorhabdales bacterium]